MKKLYYNTFALILLSIGNVWGSSQNENKNITYNHKYGSLVLTQQNVDLEINNLVDKQVSELKETIKKNKLKAEGKFIFRDNTYTQNELETKIDELIEEEKKKTWFIYKDKIFTIKNIEKELDTFIKNKVKEASMKSTLTYNNLTFSQNNIATKVNKLIQTEVHKQYNKALQLGGICCIVVGVIAFILGSYIEVDRAINNLLGDDELSLEDKYEEDEEDY